jgi:glycerophosphoryl diester phosphodiesterase
MRFVFIGIIALFAFSCTRTQEVKNYYRSFSDSEDLYNFYHYDKDAAPVIQGHRGTRENGLPESSIAAFEYVLSQMPAVFEIDPRLTKDSVIIVFHDATLERTSTGTGKVCDYTWEELQQLYLKNKDGEVTEYKIPTLAEVLEWGRGKTCFVLDKKDVPLPMIAGIIREHDANNYVINMVRSVEDALFYYNDDPRRMFSVSMRTPEVYDAYAEAGIPDRQMFACIGTKIHEGTAALCELLHTRGISCLLAVASSYDKLETPEERAMAYREVIKTGVSIVESDFPIATGTVLLTNPSIVE